MKTPGRRTGFSRLANALRGLGESVTEAQVGTIFKKVGDAVAVDEPIISLETDKVAVEAPSPVAGTIKEFKVAVGDTVEIDAVIADVGSLGGDGGGIVVTREGHPLFSMNTSGMYRGRATSAGMNEVAIYDDE